MAIDTALPDIAAEIRDAVGREIKQYPVNSNWASALGHPCERNLVYRRLNWKDKPPIGVVQAMIFNGGKVIEQNIAKVYLEKAGYQIVEADRPIQTEATGTLSKLQIAGYLDFICRKGKFEFPVEVKSMAPHSWEKISAVEDFLFSKKTWEKSYPGQLTLYMLGRDYEIGAFMLINKLTYEPKIVWVHLDYTYAESLLKKAENVNKYVAANAYPDRIEYDDAVCGRCDFAKVCLADVVRTEADILTDDSIIEKLTRREELKEAKEEFEEIDEEVKVALRGIKKGVAGSFLIVGKEVSRKGYQVPDKTFWQTSIRRMQ